MQCSLWLILYFSTFVQIRYVADISRQRAESMLKNEDKEGCFVVRNSSTPGLYTLSLYTKLPHPQVRPILQEYLQRNMRRYSKGSKSYNRKYDLLFYQVKHYHIKQNPQGGFFLSEKHCCATIPELIEYHSYNGKKLKCLFFDGAIIYFY